MPSPVYPDGADPASYRGLPVIYEYTNIHGDLVRFNCGQAAACTLLTHHGPFPAEPDAELARAVMTAVEAEHPPDNAGGWFGTSRRRVERICRTHGIELEEVAGEAELRERLAEGRPVIVVVQTEGPRFWGWHAPAGHWMVAYGYDDRHVFLTNYAPSGMPWDEFRRRWGAFVPRLISMRNTGLTAPRPTAT
jgi:Butirosin biosynthesis protein H, N-terminal